MARRETRLGAAKRHGRKAIAELRHMSADSALHWVLAHKNRVSQFRRAVKGTRAEKPFERLLAAIRQEASDLKQKPARRQARRKTTRKTSRKARRKTTRARRVPGFMPPPFLIV